MKRVMGIVMIIQLLLSLLIVNGNGVEAISNTRYIELEMGGKMVSFKEASLRLNDQEIQSDVPPIIHEGRTLVPLRIIMENIDAEVLWNKTTQEVTLKTKDQKIVLQIDKGEATVNDAKVPLPDGVPPKLIGARTMVPIRFLAETIGIEVGWNGTTQTVFLKHKKPVVAPVEEVRASAIRVNTNGYFPEIRIKTSKEVEYTESSLPNPTRLIFDFKGVKFDLVDKTNLLGDGTYRLPLLESVVRVIRIAQFQPEPDLQTRMVLEMGGTATHKVHYDKATGEMVIGFTNNVKNIKTETRNLKEVVVIEGDNVRDYNIIRLSNPERLVVDIKNAYLESENNYQMDINSKMAKSIRVSQFTPDHHYKPDDKIVRVVIDLQAKDQYPEPVFEVMNNNQLAVHLEGKPYSRLNYESVGYTTSKLVFRGTAISRYQVTRLPNSNTLEILVPKSNGPLDFSDIIVGDYMIKDIKVDTTTSNDNYRVLVEVSEEVEHAVLTPETTKDLELQLKNKNKYHEFLIIIDPGHGGTDPGAISPKLKLKEADVVLDVSHRLNKLLREAGFRTYMTRTTDHYITLEDRAGVANQLNGNLFVSVHANAFSGTKAEGLETLYYPSEINPDDPRNNKGLAQLFQNAMVEDLGGVNRGIVPREKIYVTRETKMPAVLVELGFLTNPAEEQKLATNAYRQKSAEALFKAIVKYYE
ncbi:N-acetylmuramoyl-L-alanine amidase [Alkaliphilus hydrothermalis]|uniref:N-acetylmuramoyl-L-alanine amidase n=1 Tax=Alkaliphilus hydrothermalis TaxID=1482730 RepID=A0ABS2NQD1_9FIRM|nr:N-acetylmuramoyl-L-alanine amidase [Alkaliphilus hydrothermalis]MBM7615164.1 N-acetylmuramoyl-L-alanine amidase [Alkaliphilus hydrothermalis]